MVGETEWLPMSGSETQSALVDVQALIDARGLGARQIAVVILCGLVALLDGLDLQSIGLAAPVMGPALHIPREQFGSVFSAALAGLALGAFCLGPVADRVGRKRVLIGATLCFGLFTLATSFATGLTDLLAFRFLAGLGLGGAMPSFIALTSEYCPHRLRATVVSILWAGFPLGGVVGGLIGSRLIPAYGWPSVFYVGGVVPLLVAVLLIALLPESIGFLLASGAPEARVRATLRGVVPAAAIPPGSAFKRPATRAGGVPIGQLFTAGRAAVTVLLWIGFYSVFGVLVTHTAWTPILLRGEGMDIGTIALTMAAFNFGSVIGSGSAGWVLDRTGTLRLVPLSFVLSGLCVAALGYAAPDTAAVVAVQAAIGLTLGCASTALIALAAISYPTAIRSTGVGWSMGMGRFGSFCGPLAVGLLVVAHWTAPDTFEAIGASLLLGCAATLILGVWRGERLHG